MAEIDGISYQEALKKVSAQHPKLWASYAGFVELGAKPYGQLTGQQKVMLQLVSDSTKTKRLAAHTVDVYAKCWAGIDDSGPIPQECLASYQAAVQKVLRASPNLAAAVPGIADTRIFSPLVVARLWITIGRYWHLSKRLTAVSAGQFYRFEHIVSCHIVLAKLWQSKTHAVSKFPMRIP